MKLKELKELGYNNEEEFVAEMVGCDDNYNVEDFVDTCEFFRD